MCYTVCVFTCINIDIYDVLRIEKIVKVIVLYRLLLFTCLSKLFHRSIPDRNFDVVHHFSQNIECPTKYEWYGDRC